MCVRTWVNLGFSDPLCEAHFYNGVTILRKEGKEDTAVIQKQIIELQQNQPELVKAIKASVDKAVEEKMTELKADFDAKLESQTKLLLEAIKGKA